MPHNALLGSHMGLYLRGISWTIPLKIACQTECSKRSIAAVTWRRGDQQRFSQERVADPHACLCYQYTTLRADSEYWRGHGTDTVQHPSLRHRARLDNYFRSIPRTSRSYSRTLSWRLADYYFTSQWFTKQVTKQSLCFGDTLD